MTRTCSRNISPDGLTGMIMAFEGMKHTVVLLNGPMGCKFYHSTTSQFLTVRPPLYLPSDGSEKKTPVNYNFLNQWFFRQSRVPCTYLDGYDYVYGTAEKVREGLRYLSEHVAFEVLVIVNSPGASLIGDHLEDLAKEILPEHTCIILESPGYSTDFSTGYETAFAELITQMGEKWRWSFEKKADCGKRKSVNLLGLSIWQRYCDGDLAELKRLFDLCQIDVNCCLFADSTWEEMRKMPQADLNVVLYPEMALQGAKRMEEICGIPWYCGPSLPIGFGATEQIFTEICRLLGTDVTPLRQECERARAFSWYHLDSVHQMCGLPNGARYAVEGSISQVYSFGMFFSEYLGMVPDCLEVTEGVSEELQEKLEALKQRYGNKMKTSILDSDAELIFGEANTIATLHTGKKNFCGIEISRPGMGYTDLIPKTQMGIQGSLFLVEQVINGLMSKI